MPFVVIESGIYESFREVVYLLSLDVSSVSFLSEFSSLTSCYQLFSDAFSPAKATGHEGTPIHVLSTTGWSDEDTREA